MRITMLGTGAALPDPERGQSAVLITTNAGRHYLFDCGEGATRQLVRAHVNPADVEAVFLTHLHHDHIGDFAYLAISGWMLDRQKPLRLFGPLGTRKFVSHLFEGGAFDADYQARSSLPARQANIAAMEPDVHEIDPGVVFDNGDIRVIADKVEHLPEHICPCFGVRIEADGKVVAFSGDTQPCEAMHRLAARADVLIHECTFPEAIAAKRSAHGRGHYGHTSPLQLGELAAKAGAGMLVATHFGHFDTVSPVLRRASAFLGGPEIGPDLLEQAGRDIKRHFGGPLFLARDLLQIIL